MHRFFVPPDHFTPSSVRLPVAAAEQVRRVLRMRHADQIAVFDGSGAEWTASLTVVSHSEVRGELSDRRTPGVEPAVSIVVAQAIVRSDRFEMVLQKGTELGAATFVPVITERVQAADGAQPSGARLERWQRVIQEAAEQSGRVRVPEIAGVVQLEEALRAEASRGPVLFLWETGERQGIRTALREMSAPGVPSRIAVFIGPVGGFSDHEVDAARLAGAHLAGLGPRVLRSETAAMAAITTVMYQFGQMGA